jgi:hypothetical protein
MLDLAAQMPAKLAGRSVAVLSFAAQDARKPAEWQEQTYNNRWGSLFVQPGQVMQLGRSPGTPGGPAVRHDCSTLGGSSGAPVVDLGTGYVIGVHTRSMWQEGGFAEPTWELARDPNVWQYSIRFRPDPRPEWLSRWDAPEPVAAPKPAPPDPKPKSWIDEPPIDWSQEGPRELERLIANVDQKMAIYYAENVGVPLGAIESNLPALRVWRDVLKAAANAAKLRLLIEHIANEASYAAIAGKLRAML